MDIISVLKEKSEKLASDLDSIRIEAKSILDNRIHLHFTDHSLNHSERILDKVSNIIEDLMNSDNALNEFEIFILCSSIYLHDIGMQHELTENLCQLLDIKMQDFSREDEKLNFIRKYHGKISRVWIEQNLLNNKDFRNAYFGEPRLGEFAGKIVESHNLNIHENLHDYRDEIYSDKKIRIGLIASLLSIGDVLDMDFNRVDYTRLKQISLPNESKLHWAKHYYVEGSIFENKRLTINYCFPSTLNKVEKEVYSYYFPNQTNFWINKLQTDLQDIFTENKIYFPIKEVFSSSITREKLPCELYKEILRDYKAHNLSINEKLRQFIVKNSSFDDVLISEEGDELIITINQAVMSIQKSFLADEDGFKNVLDLINNK